jgi:hypothetical protein
VVLVLGHEQVRQDFWLLALVLVEQVLVQKVLILGRVLVLNRVQQKNYRT